MVIQGYGLLMHVEWNMLQDLQLHLEQHLRLHEISEALPHVRPQTGLGLKWQYTNY